MQENIGNAIYLDDLDKVSPERPMQEGKDRNEKSPAFSLARRIMESNKLLLDLQALKKDKFEREYTELIEACINVQQILLSFPEKIKEQKSVVADFSEAVKIAEEELNLAESTLFMMVNSEVDEKGKNKYTNKEVREAALAEYKKNDEDYLTCKEELSSTKRELENAQFELDKIQNEFKVYQNIFSMNETRLSALTAVKG